MGLLAGCGGPIVKPTAPTSQVRTSAAPAGGPAETGTPDPPQPETTTADVTPPYIARVEWVQAPHGRSLHIYPTRAGRQAQGDGDDAVAWREVLHLAPDAGSAGMRAQFECHWTYARLAEPGKTSWNIEPWRPVVTDKVMTQERCNPGGPD